jgi:predicted flap endonuclease-1-like 5' DNA nuclease
MKWILHRLRRLAALPSQPAPSQEPHKPSVPKSQPVASSSHHAQTTFDAETSLKDIAGVTDQMLIAFSEHGVTCIEDLAACATDDLDGWSESKDGRTIRHAGILDHLRLSREDCEAIIINARIKAGWITS